MTIIARRTLLKAFASISLTGIFPAIGKTLPPDSISTRKIKKTIETDVLVVGGGTAGTIAAIQARRLGCSTILVENGSQLGGTITTGGVSFPGLFHAWGKQVIGGIGWELVLETVKMDDGSLPDFSIPAGNEHWNHQIRVNPYIFSLLAEERSLQAGVQIRYYETPVSIQQTVTGWEVETEGKGSHTRIFCKQLIDCTGNALVTSMAGMKVLRGTETQPGTLIFRIGGYNIDTLNLKLLSENYEKAIINGDLERDEFRNVLMLLKSRGDNIQHIAGADSTSSETHTITNQKGRTSLLKHLRFLRTLPGCEKTKLISMQPETGVRETYRIDGVYQVTHEDYLNGTFFNDAVCYSFYPIDLHDKEGVKPAQLRKGAFPTVPLRALIPKNSRNLLVAGRCVSSDRLANSALRVQASCMAMGQAAGAAAAVSVMLKTTPLNAPIDKIRSLIEKSGGIIPVK